MAYKHRSREGHGEVVASYSKATSEETISISERASYDQGSWIFIEGELGKI